MFGLPDLQLILRGVATADEAALTRDALCEQVLNEGCHLLHGTDLIDPREIAWRVSYRRSAFDPDREVVQLIEQGRVDPQGDDGGEDADDETYTNDSPSISDGSSEAPVPGEKSNDATKPAD